MKQSRRSFLKWTGVLAGSSLLPACQAKIEKLIPFLNQPEGYTPFKKVGYRTFFYDHFDFAELIVSNIDNRPVNLEGNPESILFNSGLNARIQAALFNFYNSKRLKDPLLNMQKTTWESLDEQVIELLKKNRKKKNATLLIVPHIISPTEKKAIEEFKTRWNNISIISFSPVNYTQLASANRKITGNFSIPTYALDKAKCIISFQCDFLESWLNGMKNTTQYSKAKRHFGSRFTHFQYESLFSVTGSNASQRTPISLVETTDLIFGLHARCFSNYYQLKYKANKTQIDEILTLLESSSGESLLLYGGEDEQVHQLILELNWYFNNFGNTIFPEKPDLLFSTTTSGNLQKEFISGIPDTIIFYKTNLYYYLAEGKLLKNIRRIPNRIGIFNAENETSRECTMLASCHHHFESWSDAQPDGEIYFLGQPVFNSLFNTRPAGENFLYWTGINESWSNYLKKNWCENILPQTGIDSESVWNEVRKKGKIQLQNKSKKASSVSAPENNYPDIINENGWKLQFFFDSKMGVGENRNNNFLHELADPVTKVCWNNYFTMNPEDMDHSSEEIKANGYPVAEVFFNHTSLKSPVVPVKNQAKNTIGFALGYGAIDSGSVGINGYSVLLRENLWKKNWKVDKIKWIDEIAEIAVIHETMKLPSGLLSEISKDIIYKKRDVSPEFEKWLMLIDIDLCTGCSSCVVACRVENNIPIVGKEEILKKRDIDWMKIERYELGNGQIVHIPLMCQHCDNAPCESVCPVLATVHSSDGLNQMVYNRCVGTRYCAANCVYNVRRFNWSNYWNPPFRDLNSSQTKFSRLMLNPRITVRTRGIMEKCNFCQHRIQEERENAKVEGRKIKVENLAPACASSCSANAIQFIDLNSDEGAGLVVKTDKKMYQLHKEYNTNPSVIYLSNRLKS